LEEKRTTSFSREKRQQRASATAERNLNRSVTGIAAIGGWRMGGDSDSDRKKNNIKDVNDSEVKS